MQVARMGALRQTRLWFMLILFSKDVSAPTKRSHVTLSGLMLGEREGSKCKNSIGSTGVNISHKSRQSLFTRGIPTRIVDSGRAGLLAGVTAIDTSFS